MAGSSIADRLAETNARIAAAASRAQRKAGDVKLVAVSKTKPLALIDEAARLGQHDFGENYVQEAVAKADARPDLFWHFIGSLQTNKVRDVVGRFALIHSVDRFKLAAEIAKAATKADIVQDILIQVHIGDEQSKHGADISAIDSLVEQILKLSALRLRGFMCLPPVSEKEEIGRAYFSTLRNLAERLRAGILHDNRDANILSMGTSGDFEWAILEGATHIRLGTTIFGARDAGQPTVGARDAT